MSAALNAVVEQLHITAARKLMELLESVKDPALLSRLIATALRYKIILPKEKAAAEPHAQAEGVEERATFPLPSPTAATSQPRHDQRQRARRRPDDGADVRPQQ